QVEDRLFRVHRHFLTTYSPVFALMFALPSAEDEGGASGSPAAEHAPDGRSDDDPIFLPGVTVLEFESLLKVFYRSALPSFALPQASWRAVLSIAHRFTFAEIFDRALRELIPPPTAEDAIAIIAVVEKYDIAVDRVAPALQMLVRRQEPLTEFEWEKMSWSMASHIAQARERYVAKVWEVSQRQSQSWGGNIEGALRAEAASIVDSVWGTR
ncbi:hypothetical protein OF83DRAFT_1063399, partial [Amylostereum chailletii]